MDKLRFAAAVFICGTMGVFVNHIDCPPAVIACARAVIGTAFILLVMALTKTRISRESIRKNGVLLFTSGILFGINWICLYEAYTYTTVAVASLCDYMAPVFVILLSPLLLKERITKVQMLCTAGAFLGIVLISGALGGNAGDPRGILFGMGAALSYCGLILCNKKISDVGSLERTFCQMCSAALAMIVYVLLTEELGALEISAKSGWLMLCVGVLHTGIAYWMYLPLLGKLRAQTSCVLSYIEPVVAILSSALVLRQMLSGIQIVGTILILGSTLVNELSGSLEKKPS